MAKIIIINARGQKEVKSIDDRTKAPKEDLSYQSLPGVYTYVTESRKS